MKILINDIWEKIHLTCCLLSGQGGSGKGQGGQEVTSPPDEVNSLYIRNSLKNSYQFLHTNPNFSVHFKNYLINIERCRLNNNRYVQRTIFSIYRYNNSNVSKLLEGGTKLGFPLYWHKC